MEQGEVEFEAQNDYSFGRPRRNFVVDPGPPSEIIADENEVARQAYNMGLSFGLTNYLKIGAFVEFEQERFDEVEDVSEVDRFDDLKASALEFELRYVLAKPRENGDGFAAALFTEVEIPIVDQSDETKAVSFGPILQYGQGPWSARTNLLLTKNFGGEDEDEGKADHRWDFDYAWQLAYQMNEVLALTVEGYGTVNRLGDSGSESEAVELFGDQDQHRIGPVVYYTLKAGGGLGTPMGVGKGDDDDDDAGGDDDDEEGGVTMGVGVLFGLNEDTPDATLKWSVEAEF